MSLDATITWVCWSLAVLLGNRSAVLWLYRQKEVIEHGR